MVATVCFILSIVMFLLATFGLPEIGKLVHTIPFGLAFLAAGLLFERPRP